MPEKKKTKQTKVKDLKPRKDAKGGGAGKNPTGPGGGHQITGPGGPHGVT